MALFPLNQDTGIGGETTWWHQFRTPEQCLNENHYRAGSLNNPMEFLEEHHGKTGAQPRIIFLMDE